MPVDVVHWNPLPQYRMARFVPFKRPINNFGDLIGPVVVNRILDEHGVTRSERELAAGRVLAVGSILHFAEVDDVVWGAGINGKKLDELPDASRLDIRSVRGPVTRELLLEGGGDVPDVYGDPALLWGTLFPRETYRSPRHRRESAIVPNMHDYRLLSPAAKARAVNPRAPLESIVRTIANSDFVCGSSLHGIVIAESFGIPARLIASQTEPPFKYDDYYGGTGRPDYVAAGTVDEALLLGGEPPIRWEPSRLLDAFPLDLWRS